METVNYIVAEDETAGIRLDKYISDKLTIISRSQLKARLVKVLVNGIKVKLSKKVSPGDNLQISYSNLPVPDINPENIKLDIIILIKPKTLVGEGYQKYPIIPKKFKEHSVDP